MIRMQVYCAILPAVRLGWVELVRAHQVMDRVNDCASVVFKKPIWLYMVIRSSSMGFVPWSRPSMRAIDLQPLRYPAVH
jgi:hypothetical protein